MSDELHVLIEVFAPPGEAYSRMSHALEEIKKFLVPVSVFHFLQRNFSSVSILKYAFDIIHLLFRRKLILKTNYSESM